MTTTLTATSLPTSTKESTFTPPSSWNVNQDFTLQEADTAGSATGSTVSTAKSASRRERKQRRQANLPPIPKGISHAEDTALRFARHLWRELSTAGDYKTGYSGISPSTYKSSIGSIKAASSHFNDYEMLSTWSSAWSKPSSETPTIESAAKSVYERLDAAFNLKTGKDSSKRSLLSDASFASDLSSLRSAVYAKYPNKRRDRSRSKSTAGSSLPASSSAGSTLPSSV